MRRKKRKLFSIVRKGSSKEVEDESPTVHLQVGKHLWENVPKSMRTELWMSVLHRRGLGTAAAEKYQSLLQQELPADVTDTIDKDLARTFPDIRRFTTREGQEAMGRVLKAYAAYDPEIGYCQGMNFLAGMLILYMATESHAFGALVVLMYERGLRDLYDNDMSLLQVRLWQLAQLLPEDLLNHLESTGCLTVLFASSWILTSFVSDFPYQVAGRIMDVLMADSFDHVVLKVALAVLLKNKREIMRIREMEEIVNFLTVTVPGWKPARLHELLSEALAKPWKPDQLAILRQTSDVETVHEAVSRVELGIVSPRFDSTTSSATLDSGRKPPSTSSTAERNPPPSRTLLKIPPVSSWNSRSSGPTPTSAKSSFESHPPSPALGSLHPSVEPQLPPAPSPTSPVRGPRLTPLDIDSIESLGLEDNPHPSARQDPPSAQGEARDIQRLDSWAWVSAEPSPANSQTGEPRRLTSLSMSEIDSVSQNPLDVGEGSLSMTDLGRQPFNLIEMEGLPSASREIRAGGGEVDVQGKVKMGGDGDGLGWVAGVGLDPKRRKALSGSDVGKEGFEFKWIEAVVRNTPR